MYLTMTATYPNDKIKEVVDVYLKAMAKYPDDTSLATPIVPVGTHATPKGMEVIVIYEVKKGKYEEALALGLKRMGMFNDIQGYRWEIRNFLNVEEVMKLMG
jgi:hypothetical protein